MQGEWEVVVVVVVTDDDDLASKGEQQQQYIPFHQFRPLANTRDTENLEIENYNNSKQLQLASYSSSLSSSSTITTTTPTTTNYWTLSTRTIRPFKSNDYDFTIPWEGACHGSSNNNNNNNNTHTTIREGRKNGVSRSSNRIPKTFHQHQYHTGIPQL